MAHPRKRQFADPLQYYAYIWRLKDVVIYVGYGKNNRGRPEIKSSGRPPALLTLLRRERLRVVVEYRPCDSKHSARLLEKQLIADLHPVYNVAPQWGGYPGMHTQDGLKRISIANTGREVSEEVREKQRVRMLGNTYLVGHVHTAETKEKISTKGKGRPASELCKQKSRERMIERNKSNPPRKGKKCSEEHKRKVSEAARKRVKNARKV